MSSQSIAVHPSQVMEIPLPNNEKPLSQYELPRAVAELTEEQKSMGKSASVILALFAAINTVIIQIMKNDHQSTAWRILRASAYIGLLLNASGAVSAILVIHNAHLTTPLVRHHILKNPGMNSVANKAYRDEKLEDHWLDLEKQSQLAAHFGIGSIQAYQYLYVYLTMGVGFLCLLITVTLWPLDLSG
ncbi:hypothetical protein FRC17_010782 [Serendipita sp. 399]|nr:hypothetical protein FRC17_010782 [Serendipita sp. 399]